MKYLLNGKSNEALEGLINFVLRVCKDDTEYTIELKQRRHLRSLDQNKYYWFILTYAAIHIGDYKEEVHHEFAKKFLPKEITIPGTGRTKIIGRSTSGLDTYEFTIYIKQIKAFLLREYQVAIPEKDRVKENEFDRVNNEYELMIAA